MKVSTTQPFQIVYSIFEHQYLGYLIDSYVVQVNSKGQLTLQYQNVASQNAHEFEEGLDKVDFEIIKLSDSIQQEYIVKKFYNKKITVRDFFLKIYASTKGKNKKDQQSQRLIETIQEHIETRKQKILEKLFKHGKQVFIMEKDGNPTGQVLNFAEEATTVLFHFRRNEDNTHYFPTLKYLGKKLDFQYKGAFILADYPAWMVLNGKIHFFANEVDGKKIKPFLNKKFIAIKRSMEETYYEKFVAPLVESFDVYAKGFEIKTENHQAIPYLIFSEYESNRQTLGLFESNKEDSIENQKILVELKFKYGSFTIKPADKKKVKVKMEKNEDDYTFYRLKRVLSFEQKVLKILQETGLTLQKSSVLLTKSKAFGWIAQNQESIQELGLQIRQQTQNEKRYFLGQADISIEIKENRDWFDIHAVIRFGEFEIPFLKLRKLILQKRTEFELPNGEIAVIPDVWFEKYSSLFNFSENGDGQPKLKKYHLSLLEELSQGNNAQIRLNQKLEKFRSFEEIEDYSLPEGFDGELRSYQKAGYNWLRFLNEYGFGGCLADDMGLGKTVQALALLQAQKEKGKKNASLLVIPTSLIYNWQLEARKFAPDLNIYVYTGTSRKKDSKFFEQFDLIITSYGIVRVDIEILQEYYFNYIILDESQAIKNPSSNISQSVRKLQSQYRLILTGTPLENTAMDLWSQMSFINPGLLGTQSFFKNEFLNPIEKNGDAEKIKKLSQIIKPFILRRHKSQVARDLPEKIENVQFCGMSDEQEKIYERIKSQYRNEILEQIDSYGVARSQMLLIQGLTKLRQIANHPFMIDQEYQGNSGKLEDILYKLESIVSEDSKVLIFSQFVKHLSIIKNYIEQRGWKYSYLDGGTQDRQGQVEQFQSDSSTKIFLISLKAGGVGLNLTAAEYVFLLDPWWNPAIEAQAVDRAHRIGQTKTVFTYKFITKNTVEEKILTLQKNKQKLAQELITTDETFMKNLTKEDVLHLLE